MNINTLKKKVEKRLLKANSDNILNKILLKSSIHFKRSILISELSKKALFITLPIFSL